MISATTEASQMIPSIFMTVPKITGKIRSKPYDGLLIGFYEK